MSNKLVKNNKGMEVEENKTEKKVELNIRDISLSIVLIILAVLKELTLDIPEMFNISETLHIGLMITSIIGFVLIAAVCGSYQNKVQGDKISVASVIKESRNKTLENEIIPFINNVIRLIELALAATLLNCSIAVIVLIISAVEIVITTIKNRFKLMDAGYTAYTIGMLAVIFTGLNK